jgi:hypothetical protein
MPLTTTQNGKIMNVRFIALSVLSLAIWGNAALAGQIKITARSGVNVRNTSGKVIGSLSHGETAEVVKVEGKYTYIKFGGKTARVYTKYTQSISGGGDDEWTTTQTQGGEEERVAPTPTTKPVKEAKAEQGDDTGGGSSTFDSTLKYNCSPAAAWKRYKKATGRKDCVGTKYFNPLKADSGSCGNVTVNCGSHKISFSGISIPASERTINCGKYGKSKDGYGTIGKVTGGNRVPNAVDINGIKGMGDGADGGGGRWFHVPWWTGKPSGANVSRGCIHVSPLVLALIKRCEGSKLHIINSYGPNNPNGKDKDEGEAQGNF